MHHAPNPFRLACFAMFFLGQFIHAWLEASQIVHDKSNSISTYAQYMDYRAPQVIARFFGCYLLYESWQMGYLATMIGILVPGAETLMNAHPHPIPVNHITAGAFGFLADYGLRYGISQAIAMAKKKFPGTFGKDLPPAEDLAPVEGGK